MTIDELYKLIKKDKIYSKKAKDRIIFFYNIIDEIDNIDSNQLQELVENLKISKTKWLSQYDKTLPDYSIGYLIFKKLDGDITSSFLKKLDINDIYINCKSDEVNNFKKMILHRNKCFLSRELLDIIDFSIFTSDELLDLYNANRYIINQYYTLREYNKKYIPKLRKKDILTTLLNRDLYKHLNKNDKGVNHSILLYFLNKHKLEYLSELLKRVHNNNIYDLYVIFSYTKFDSNTIDYVLSWIEKNVYYSNYNIIIDMLYDVSLEQSISIDILIKILDRYKDRVDFKDKYLTAYNSGNRSPLLLRLIYGATLPKISRNIDNSIRNYFIYKDLFKFINSIDNDKIRFELMKHIKKSNIKEELIYLKNRLSETADNKFDEIYETIMLMSKDKREMLLEKINSIEEIDFDK